MTDDIITGIAQTIDDLYPGSHIYTDEDVSQGLETPAFILESPSASIGPGYMSGRLVHHLVDITYLPEKEGSRDECVGVGDALGLALGLISLPSGQYIRGTDISYQVVSGVLHMTASYDHAVVYVSSAEVMESLTDDIRIKE